MSKYEYRPLPEGSIRLLRIKPNTDQGAPIECEILVYPILDSGRTSLYEGLSYVWGSQDNPRSIRINGCEFPVGGNLYSAISALRDRYLDRVMWVDAICINQADKNEKGHQVQAMARIYAQARGVVVWLGAGTLKTSKAIRAIQRLALLPGDTQKTDRQSGPEDPAGSQNAGSLPKPSVECLGHGEQEAIMHLFHLPWFERVWVLQEVAAARHVLVKAGADEITGDAFCAGLARWLAECAEEPLDPESQLLDSTIHSVTRLMRDTELRPRNDYDTSIPARFSCNIAPLGELIELYRSRKATDDRDKIYALLGMSSDNPAAVGLEPDYNISWAELMQRRDRLGVY
ncbi:HET-domain-containing protein [Cladorrhinum sp. PSN332]|nr:HET-domain-containing protein [Cladorrhinum sp. PSN332]